MLNLQSIFQKIFPKLKELLGVGCFSKEESLEVRKRTVKSHFLASLGYEPDLDNPKTYNEKLQWLKLYYRDPLLTKCADKFEVREYVREKIGERYLAKLLGVYESAGDIDFGQLPEKFVLKVNHGSGQNIICKDKKNLDIEDAKKKLEFWMQPKSNHYYFSYEWSYKNIKPKIVCEEYLDQGDGKLNDYKILCFGGEPKYIWVDFDRFGEHKRNIYDTDWNYLNDFKYSFPNDAKLIEKKPENLGEILEVARKLSAGFPHVRVDIYLVKGRIYFGELTFYPANGTGKFFEKHREFELGELIKLPFVAKKI